MTRRAPRGCERVRRGTSSQFGSMSATTATGPMVQTQLQSLVLF